MNILLIEDNLIDRMAFLRLLEKEKLDCKLEVVENINKAKDFLSKNQYQLVVCDLNLPDGTAFDLSGYFADNEFVIVTGYVDTELEQKAKSVGIFKVISKSNDLKQLTEIVNLIKQKKGKKHAKQASKKTHLASENYNGILSHLKRTFDNNPAYISDIINSFLIENPKQISRLNLALEINDQQQIIKTAHQLKSGYMLLGFKELESLSAELEAGCSFENEMLHDRIQTISDLSLKAYYTLNVALLELKNPA